MAGIDLKSLLANFTNLGGAKDKKGNLIDKKTIDEITKEFTAITDQMDELSDSSSKLASEIKKLKESLKTTSRTSLESKEILDKLKEKREEKNAADKILVESEQEYISLLKNLEEQYGKNEQDLKNYITSEEKYNKTMASKILSASSFARAISSLGDSFGKAISDSKGFSGNFSDEVTSLKKLISLDLAEALKLAAKQVIELNDRLIRFQREQSGTLNARMLGYDVFGNNQGVGSGSLTSLATRNNVSVDQMLESFKSFSQGSAIGLTADLNNSQAALQKFGVEFAKTEKLYGVASGTLQKFSETFLYDFGMPIDKISDTLKKGADIALQAGINVNKFFENMSALGNSTLFTRNGIEGIEKSALVLSKLGLTVSSLEQLANSYDSFSTLIQKQQNAVALGLNNVSTIQNRVFAKIQTGDTPGAAKLLTVAGANDVTNLGQVDKNGIINQQGRESLKAAGYTDEQIKATQRLIIASKKLGASIEDIVNDNLSIDQKNKKIIMEQNDATVSEKFAMLFQKIKGVLIDPLASVLGPALDIVVNSLMAVFTTLEFVLKPVVWAFGQLGKVLTWISIPFKLLSDHITKLSDKISNFFSSFSLGDNPILNGIWETLKTILGVVISIKVISAAKSATSGITDKIFDFIPGAKKFKALRRLKNINKIRNAANAANTISKASKVSKILKGGAITAGLGEGLSYGIDAYTNYKTAEASGASKEELDKLKTKGVAKTTGAVVGGGLGAWGGAAIGTQIGVALAPFTFGISALVGPLLGAAAGSWAGAKAADELTDAMLENNEVLKKADKDPISAIGSIMGGAPSTSKIADIMNAKRLDANDDKKAQQEENMAKAEQTTLKQNIIINQQIDGRLKARVAGF